MRFRGGYGLARLARYLRETRLANRLPLSWIAIVVLISIAGIAASALRDAFLSTRDPRPTSLAQIFAADPPENRHVEVEGRIQPETRVLTAPDRRGVSQARDDMVYVAMIGDPPRILLVRDPGDLDSRNARARVVRGLLRPPEASLARRLDVAGWQIGGIPVEPRYVLIPGLTPPLAWQCGLVFATFASLSIGWIASEIAARRGSAKPPLSEGDCDVPPDRQSRSRADGPLAG